MLKILGKLPSINVRKVTWACDELSLPYKREDWGIGFRDTNVPEYLALNPMAQVPVLIDGDFVLWESNTIVRYLAGAYGGEALLPTEPKARALVERWMDWQATDLNASWKPAFHALRRGASATPEAIAASKTAWNKAIGKLDQQLAKTGAYVAGDAFTAADIPVGLSVHRWMHTPLERPDFAAVEAYYARLKARPAFADSADPDEP